MVEIHPGLFVGPREDYEELVRFLDGWYVVHACNEPYHREAVGYLTDDALRGHPERLVARRGRRLMLNLIDAVVDVDIPPAIFDAALEFIHEGLTRGHQVLVHCEVAASRSPAIGLLYLAAHSDRFPVGSFEEAEPLYLAVYPDFSPGRAIRRFLVRHWCHYARPAG